MIVNASATTDITACMPNATTITMLSIEISVPSSVRNPALVPRASEFATTTATEGPGTMVNSRHVAMYGKRIAELIIRNS
jgi:hypothetical protein